MSTEVHQSRRVRTGKMSGIKLLGTWEVAEILGCCTETVRRLVHAGHLPARKMPGGSFRVLNADLHKYIMRQPAVEPAAIKKGTSE